MVRKKDLEEKIKEKVSPLVMETLEKSLGVSIPKVESDITDTLLNPMMDMYIPFDKSFKEAKKVFKKEFIKKELHTHLGNVSLLAKVLGLDRRSIHRAIKELDIDLEHVRMQHGTTEQSEDFIDHAIRDTLEQYKSVIHPLKMERIYSEVPALSRNIAKILPRQEVTWKEAEKDFEKQFLERALEKHAGKISDAAKNVGLRVETLHRKIRKLGLR